MGFISNFFKAPSSSAFNITTIGLINSGRKKKTGGHDHRTNKGDDRTPAQKNGDKKPNTNKS